MGTQLLNGLFKFSLAALILTFGILILVGKACNRYKSESERYFNNYMAEVETGKKNVTRVRELTKREFEATHKKIVEQLKKENIKLRNLLHVTNIRLKAEQGKQPIPFTKIDTIYSVGDSIKLAKRYTLKNECFGADVIVPVDKILSDSIIYVDNLTYQDSLMLTAYWQRDKGFMGVRWFWKRKNTFVKVTSKCDAIDEVYSVDIIRKER